MYPRNRTDNSTLPVDSEPTGLWRYRNLPNFHLLLRHVRAGHDRCFEFPPFTYHNPTGIRILEPSGPISSFSRNHDFIYVANHFSGNDYLPELLIQSSYLHPSSNQIN